MTANGWWIIIVNGSMPIPSFIDGDPGGGTKMFTKTTRENNFRRVSTALALGHTASPRARTAKGSLWHLRTSLGSAGGPRTAQYTARTL